MGSATPCPPKGGLAVESNTKLHHRNAIPPGPTPGGEGGGAGADAARRAEDAERALKWADERRTRKAARKGDVRAPEAATAPSQ